MNYKIFMRKQRKVGLFVENLGLSSSSERKRYHDRCHIRRIPERIHPVRRPYPRRQRNFHYPTGKREAPCSNVFGFFQRFSKRTISCKKTESARNIKTLPLRFAANNAWGVFHEKSRHFRDGGLCYTMQKLLHFASELTFFARRDFLRAALFL